MHHVKANCYHLMLEEVSIIANMKALNAEPTPA